MPPKKRRKRRSSGATPRPRIREKKGTILRRIEKQLEEEAKQKALSQGPLQETAFETIPPGAEPRCEVQPDPLARASLHRTVNHALEPTDGSGNSNGSGSSNNHHNNANDNDDDDDDDDDEHRRPPAVHTLRNRRIAIGVYFEMVLKSPPESLWRKFRTIPTISDVFREDRNMVRKVCRNVLYCQQHHLAYTGKPSYENREAPGGEQTPVATATVGPNETANVGHSVTPEGKNPRQRLEI